MCAGLRILGHHLPARKSALKPSSTARAMNILSPAKYFSRTKNFSAQADLHQGGSGGCQRGEEEPAAVQSDDDQAGVENGDVAEQTAGLSTPVERRMGVRKPPNMPRMATTSALSRTARRNAAVVMRVISKKVGRGPKNLK